MFIKFIKNHEIGISKDATKDVSNNLGEKFISQGYAIEVSETDFLNYKYQKPITLTAVETKEDCCEEVKEEEQCEDCQKRKKRTKK